MFDSEIIFLRDLEIKDALTSRHWRNDPEIWKYTASRPNCYITEEIETEWIKGVLADKTRKTLAICLKEDSRYVGNVQVTNIKDDEAVFHLFIGDKTVWGKGIGSAATLKMVEFAKNNLKLKKLTLWVNLENIAAKKAYLKAGFVPVDDKGNMEVILR